MREQEEVSFDFMSDTSGRFDRLLERLGVPEDDAVKMALHYYARYLDGTRRNGPLLVIIDPETQTGVDLDDEITEEYKRCGIVTVSFDKTILDGMTTIAGHDDPTDLMTSAFVLLEKACDARDIGWKVGVYDDTVNPPEVTLLDMIDGSAGTPAPAKAPPGPHLH